MHDKRQLSFESDQIATNNKIYKADFPINSISTKISSMAKALVMPASFYLASETVDGYCKLRISVETASSSV